jgi:hypothetical protein
VATCPKVLEPPLFLRSLSRSKLTDENDRERADVGYKRRQTKRDPRTRTERERECVCVCVCDTLATTNKPDVHAASVIAHTRAGTTPIVTSVEIEATAALLALDARLELPRWIMRNSF